MRHLAYVLALAACSNAATPSPDASVIPIDSPAGDMGTGPDAAPLRLLVVNEVAAGEDPDWIEVVNASTSPLQLADFKFVDAAGDLVKAVAFPSMMLAPGAFFAQDLDGMTVPFKLGGDEEVWIYRASDGALSDGVDWDEGQAATGMSFARSPDIVGAFATTATPTKGAANQ